MKKNKHKTISRLLVKFLKGSTSLRDEKQLRKFFLTSEDIPTEWQCYKKMFEYFEQGMAKNNTASSWQKVRMTAVAASALLLLGFGIATLFKKEPIQTELATTTAPEKHITEPSERPLPTTSKAVYYTVKSRFREGKKQSFTNRKNVDRKTSINQKPTSEMPNKEELATIEALIEMDMRHQQLLAERQKGAEDSAAVEPQRLDVWLAALEETPSETSENIETANIDL